MDKYAFLNDHEHVNDNLGISYERHVEILKACRIAMIEGDCCVGGAMEYAMNKIQPKNMVEAMYVGFVLKSVIEFGNPLTQLMTAISKMRGNDE